MKKSQILKEMAEKQGIKVVDIPLSKRPEPDDLTGFPQRISPYEDQEQTRDT